MSKSKPITIDIESRDFTRLGTEMHKAIMTCNPGDDPRLRQLFAYASVGDHAGMVLTVCGDSHLDHTSVACGETMEPVHDGMIIDEFDDPQWLAFKVDFTEIEERILNHRFEDRLRAIDLCSRKELMTRADFKLDPIPEPPNMIPTRTPHRRDWEQRTKKRRR